MSELIATAASSINAFTLAKRVAAFNVPVLIQGETGAGKECVAKYIHTVAFGENESAPYVGVNCAAIPENMLESTLFGYDKGAFTGAIASVPGKMELANNGSLLLDEIGEMPLALQAKILRVLQEQQVERLGSNRQIKLNFRLIACTNKNLEQEVAAGRFREDLYYRLAVIPITMPPLRERLNDIIPLAESFIKKYSTVLVKNITLSESTRRALLNYRWPGNVRQLENAIQRGMILNRDGVIYPDALGLLETDVADHSELQWPVQPAVHIAETSDLGQHGRSAQYQYIADLMRKYQGNQQVILDQMRERDEDVLEQLQDEMYDFFILSRQNEEVRRRLLDEVPMEDWAVALKGTEALLRRSIYAVMPKRQAQQLEAITARLGPVPVSRIEQIRREIMGIARELEEAGEIQLQLFAEQTAE